MTVSTIPAAKRVLPTLNNDGSRRWIRPKTFKGPHYRRRLILAWGLIGLFIALPFVQVGGHPSILLDIPTRRFFLFGHTFLPTDGLLLMLAALAAFIAVFWVTALFGRVWCGWGCPQTLYLEFVFRPIEQWLEGSRGQQRKLDTEGANWRRVLKFLIYAVLSVIVANIFLAYFVGVERLAVWLVTSPLEHPTPFLVVLSTSGLVFFDFAYFREQMCTIICPYARLQSVLLDPASLVVGYDSGRGEPRRSGRRSGGDCIDCQACVIACPTGIDIREGLQLECIACTQCADACDQVMAKIKKPLGLVRYSTQLTLENRENEQKSRPRLIIYPVMLTLLVSALVFFGSQRSDADIVVLRGLGAPFVVQTGTIRNQLRIKIRNRTDHEAAYHISLSGAGDSEFISPENPLRIAAGRQLTTTAFVISPPTLFSQGVHHIKVNITDGKTFQTEIPYKLLGPSTRLSTP